MPNESPQGTPSLDVHSLTFEQARDRLAAIVEQLATAHLPLEELIKLWEQGEALAKHCEALLDQARLRLEAGEDSMGANSVAGRPGA